MGDWQHTVCTPRPAERGEWGWSEDAPGQYQSGPPPPWLLYLILTQSLHLKNTCGKRALSNSSSLYTLFYFVIYSSVGRTWRIHNTLHTLDKIRCTVKRYTTMDIDIFSTFYTVYSIHYTVHCIHYFALEIKKLFWDNRYSELDRYWTGYSE